jgi:hypothetical protein
LRNGSTLTAGGVTWKAAPCSKGVCSIGVMSVSYLTNNPCGVQVFADAHIWVPGMPDKWVGEVEYDDQAPPGLSVPTFCQKIWRLPRPALAYPPG